MSMSKRFRKKFCEYLGEHEVTTEELADNLEIFTGKRSCPICGCEPEKQQKMIEEELKRMGKALRKFVKDFDILKYDISAGTDGEVASYRRWFLKELNQKIDQYLKEKEGK